MFCLTLSSSDGSLLRIFKGTDYQWVDEVTSTMMELRDVGVDHVPADHACRLSAGACPYCKHVFTRVSLGVKMLPLAGVLLLRPNNVLCTDRLVFLLLLRGKPYSPFASDHRQSQLLHRSLRGRQQVSCSGGLKSYFLDGFCCSQDWACWVRVHAR
jgi:hypothetical protein